MFKSRTLKYTYTRFCVFSIALLVYAYGLYIHSWYREIERKKNFKVTDLT